MTAAMNRLRIIDLRNPRGRVKLAGISDDDHCLYYWTSKHGSSFIELFCINPSDPSFHQHVVTANISRPIIEFPNSAAAVYGRFVVFMANCPTGGIVAVSADTSCRKTFTKMVNSSTVSCAFAQLSWSTIGWLLVAYDEAARQPRAFVVEFGESFQLRDTGIVLWPGGEAAGFKWPSGRVAVGFRHIYYEVTSGCLYVTDLLTGCSNKFIPRTENDLHTSCYSFSYHTAVIGDQPIAIQLGYELLLNCYVYELDRERGRFSLTFVQLIHSCKIDYNGSEFNYLGCLKSSSDSKTFIVFKHCYARTKQAICIQFGVRRLKELCADRIRQLTNGMSGKQFSKSIGYFGHKSIF